MAGPPDHRVAHDAGAGELDRDADASALALGLLAAAQGGLLLVQTARTTTPLEIAIDLALEGIAARLEPTS